MPSFNQAMSIIAMTAISSVNAAFGPAFSTGPVSSDSFIRESTATLVLPKAPSGSSGDASLWVGMGTSNGDLIQSIADNWESSTWSIFAYTLLSTSATTQMPVQGDSSTATAGDQVTMHYKFDDSTGNYTQTVLVNNKTVSTLSTSDGEAQGWGSAVECAENNCGTMPAHTWINAKIILDSADPNYINTMYKGEGVTGTMSTSDGGKTWEIGTIGIPEFTFGSS
ncbi:hypothetical protein N7462_000964 [Penicillium macrosclerotiorum]|uniref:uncharacterized protein n=1 Tax=Penicillium macrosclerotiorum TaxID=303699 RepID=UPI002548245E|nr:uncharacterized protein N7462_000964 [Penicillium macrosclerotiorum]KAJ5698959.1 hypothetical protein N7462_000964 [Penicillium macrosclerotiorum]